MNKEIFLRDLRRFLADIPEDEREQALNYYEDYFEDAGPENEQKVIEELGSPIDIAKQIMATNQENIAYGQGNDFHQTTDYPNVYENTDNAKKGSQNFGGTSNHSKQANWSQSTNQYSQNQYYNNPYSQGYGTQTGGNGQQQKKRWTQDSSKVTIVIILAILAIPVGIPLVSAIFGILVSICAVIFSLIGVCFGVGSALAVSGVVTLIASFFLTSSAGIASVLVTAGIGLVMFSVGVFMFWLAILFCGKFFPAVFSGIGKCFHTIGNGIKNFFN